MTISSRNGHKVKIADSHFLTSGGEADIYLKDGIIYKIFQKERSHNFISKLNILQTLDKPNIVSPKDVLYDQNNTFVGYSMKYLHNTESLTKLFTKSYKTRNNITTDSILKLIETLRTTTEYIHKNNCVIVDGNENNFLFEKAKLDMPYFIDIDSYQTKGHKATAFSPMITDPKAIDKKIFNEITDWYSYAIITFQLLTNIHPFKGKHPDYTKKDVLLRMKNNVSVFDSKTNLPASVEDFSIIPKGLLTWYEDTFVKGNRSLPPMNMFQNVPPKVKEISMKGSDKLKITEVKDIRMKKFFKMKEDKVGYTELADIIGHKNLSILSEDSFVELSSGMLKLNTFSYNVMAATFNMNVPLNTKLYDGAAYYPIFKKNHFIVANDTSLVHTNLDGKLDGYKITDCSYRNNVLVVSMEKDKKYFVGIFKQNTNGFSRDFNESYIVEVDAPAECNYTVLKNGMIILLNPDEDLIITHVKKDQYKILRDVKIPLDGILCTDAYGEKVLLEYKNKIYQIEMK
jgi:serine/threonine protein kinase